MRRAGYIAIALAVLVAALIAASRLWMTDKTAPADEGPAVAPSAAIALVRVGPVSERDAAFAKDAVAAAFGCPVVEEHALPLPTAYYVPARGQYRAFSLLRYVEANAADGYRFYVAVTAADVYDADLNFLFGISRLPGKCALVSTRRLAYYSERPKQRDLRFVKLLWHELSHAHGLRHCRQRRCLMAFADTFSTLDGQSCAWCERCEKALGLSYAETAPERRARIRGFLGKYGLLEEAGGAGALAPPPPPADLSPAPNFAPD